MNFPTAIQIALDHIQDYQAEFQGTTGNSEKIQSAKNIVRWLTILSKEVRRLGFRPDMRSEQGRLLDILVDYRRSFERYFLATTDDPVVANPAGGRIPVVSVWELENRLRPLVMP